VRRPDPAKGSVGTLWNPRPGGFAPLYPRRPSSNDFAASNSEISLRAPGTRDREPATTLENVWRLRVLWSAVDCKSKEFACNGVRAAALLQANEWRATCAVRLRKGGGRTRSVWPPLLATSANPRPRPPMLLQTSPGDARLPATPFEPNPLVA
jgi:hypothetical protein